MEQVFQERKLVIYTELILRFQLGGAGNGGAFSTPR